MSKKKVQGDGDKVAHLVEVMTLTMSEIREVLKDVNFSLVRLSDIHRKSFEIQKRKIEEQEAFMQGATGELMKKIPALRRAIPDVKKYFESSGRIPEVKSVIKRRKKVK